MELIPNELTRAALDARDRFAGFAQKTATAQLSGGFAPTQATMAAAAQAAVFSDALSQALRAHLEELKTVSKA
jgi:hypothetical protein